MLVSIIIPAYNEEDNISLCLDSIFSMNYPRDEFEVIVIDNGSTDGTREIAEKFDITLLMDDTKNVSGLRNLGAQVAKGKILAFVDADCLVSEEWLKNAEKYFNSTETAAWGSPPVIPENATWVQKAWYLVRQKEKSIQKVEWLESMNLFVRKDLFTKVGGFNENLITAEDVDLSYRISEFGNIISDSNIKVCHLGEAATIKEFIRKELWRGIGNLSGIKSHGLNLKEIPSLIIPGYFGIFLPLVFILSIIINVNFIFFVLLYMVPSFAVLYKVIRKKKLNSLISLGHMIVLLQIYFFCRTFAVISITSK